MRQSAQVEVAIQAGAGTASLFVRGVISAVDDLMPTGIVRRPKITTTSKNKHNVYSGQVIQR